jgi:hypothetical protein
MLKLNGRTLCQVWLHFNVFSVIFIALIAFSTRLHLDHHSDRTKLEPLMILSNAFLKKIIQPMIYATIFTPGAGCIKENVVKVN